MNEWQQLYHIDHEQNLLSKTNLDAAHVSFLRLIVYKQRVFDRLWCTFFL